METLRKEDAFFECSLIERFPFEDVFVKINIAQGSQGIYFLLILYFLLQIGDHLYMMVCLLKGFCTDLLISQSVSDVEGLTSDWHAEISGCLWA